MGDLRTGVQVFEVPVDLAAAGLHRAYELHVPTESGEWVEVNVFRNLVRDTYEIEFAAALFDQSPQALTATIQLAMLALREAEPEAGCHRRKPATSGRHEDDRG